VTFTTIAWPERGSAARSRWRAAPERPVVSVCIVNWNCRELLRRCLASLFDQDQGVPFEVVVVDNASSDGAVDDLEREFPEVVLIRNVTNRGFSRGNNQAAAASSGQYFFFLNNDTEIAPHTLADFVAVAERVPNAGMIGPKLLGPRGEVQISYRTRPTLGAMLHRIGLLRWTGLFRKAYARYRRDQFDPNGERSVEVLMGAAVFLPRAIFEAAGRWDEGYDFGAEDLDLSTQVGRYGTVHFCSDIEVLHHGRVSSRENIGFAAPNTAIGFVRYFRKAGTAPIALTLYKALVTADLPCQLFGKLAQGAWRYLGGRKLKAKKSWNAAGGLWHFLRRDLGRFWAA